MGKFFRRLYFRLFKRYERIELKCINWPSADALLKENRHKPEEEQWHIAPEEDHNQMLGAVFLERRRRIRV